MEAQALLQFAPLLVSTQRKKSLPINVKSSPRANTKHCRVSAFSASLTAPTREKDSKKRVVITGMGVISVFGNNVDTFYEGLLKGENRVTLIDKFDASKLPTRFGAQIRDLNADGYIDENNDLRLDPCPSYSIVSANKALELASLDVHEWFKINKERAGVIIGSGFGGISILSSSFNYFIDGGYEKIPSCFAPYIVNKVAAVTAINLDFMGPNYSIASACATSNYC